MQMVSGNMSFRDVWSDPIYPVFGCDYAELLEEAPLRVVARRENKEGKKRNMDEEKTVEKDVEDKLKGPRHPSLGPLSPACTAGPFSPFCFPNFISPTPGLLSST